MNIGILGAGSIGAYLGGRLTAAGVTTVLVARQGLVDAVGAHGLHLTALDGFDVTLPPRPRAHRRQPAGAGELRLHPRHGQGARHGRTRRGSCRR